MANYKWRVRDAYFTGPGEATFKFRAENSDVEQKFKIDVDRDGYFETENIPASVPIGIFAHLIRPD